MAIAVYGTLNTKSHTKNECSFRENKASPFDYLMRFGKFSVEMADLGLCCLIRPIHPNISDGKIVIK